MVLPLILITYGRSELFARCLNSLYEATARAKDKDFQLLVLVNGPDSRSQTIIEQAKWPKHVRVDFFLNNQTLPPGEARNVLLEKVKVPRWICFIDDDAFVAPDYFCQFFYTLNLFPQAQVIGGPNLTPEKCSQFQVYSGWLLENWMVSGPFAKRYRQVGSVGWTDTAGLILCNCFVFWRKELQFPVRVACGEELLLFRNLQDEFRNRLNGKKLFIHNPQLRVFHERRPNPKSYTYQMLKYGVGRGEATSLGLLAVMVFLFVLLPLSLPRTLLFYLICVYLTYIISVGFLIVRKKQDFRRDLLSPLKLSLLIALQHSAYATGILSSLFIKMARKIYEKRLFDNPSGKLKSLPEAKF
jgi:glycosyltransferase involved in cell wall biosynthesis